MLVRKEFEMGRIFWSMLRWQEKLVGSYENNIKSDFEKLNVGVNGLTCLG